MFIAISRYNDLHFTYMYAEIKLTSLFWIVPCIWAMPVYSRMKMIVGNLTFSSIWVCTNPSYLFICATCQAHSEYNDSYRMLYITISYFLTEACLL